MDHPEFSVIVCVYNGEKYLKECLDSIVGQLFKNLEIIIVDDGSTDRTGEICHEYAALDDRVRVIHQKNTGKSIAIKTGIQKSTGNYFSIVDSDDWLDPGYLSYMKDHANKGVDMVLQGFVIEPKHQTITTNYGIKNKCVSGSDLINSNDSIHTANDACFSWRILFRRQFVVENDLFPNPEIVIGEDTEMNLRALKAADKVICTDYAGYHYRSDNQGSLMRRKYLQTYEHDLDLQFLTRSTVSQNESYRFDMARYYVETVLYRVLDNAKNAPGGLRYPDIRRIFRYNWLRESYRILGRRLKEITGNKNAYLMNLLIKYRLCLLYYLLNRK